MKSENRLRIYFCFLSFGERKNVFAEKLSCFCRFDVENFVVDRNGNALVFAFTHTERAFERNFVLKIVFLNEMAERSDYALGAAEVTACSDANFDFYHLFFTLSFVFNVKKFMNPSGNDVLIN